MSVQKREKITQMYVTTRSGTKEKVSFDKILERLERLSDGLNVDIFHITQETIKGLHNDINTSDLDKLSADISATNIHLHPDYNKFASRIAINNLHKQTFEKYVDVVKIQFENNKVSKQFYDFVMENEKQLQSMLNYERDYGFDFFGFKTLERSYLFKVNNKTIERPQHLFLRVAIQIHSDTKDFVRIKETYDYMSQFYFTHASPTLFNSGTNHPQLSSCFLLHCEDDLSEIFNCIKNIGMISKWAGGIGISLSDVRAKGSLIHGTGGDSDGIIPLCKVLEATARYVNQGGKRKGSVAVFLEPWHADIQSFLELRKPTGDENLRARDLFLALWVSDLFMKRVEKGGKWSLMCPSVCPGLTDAYGEEFEKLYIKYENEGKFVKQIYAIDLWNSILENQFETGVPYMLSKDASNLKSNQKNLGTIKSSNLCAEIIEFSSKNETAVCNLASICLSKFVVEREGKTEFDFDLLKKITRIVTYNLNKIIDCNFYPTKETRYSNLRNRPIGIGVQGLSDAYRKLRYSFESNEARILNKKIFETIYISALEESVELAKQLGPYETFADSPFSKGQPQWALWNLSQDNLYYDWTKVIENMKKYGTRNSLLTALMPTASTSQIMGNTEAFEQITSNYYVRQTLAGEYTIINEQLVHDLIEAGLWKKEIYEEIIFDNGSIQNIDEIPQNLKDLYKTAYEIKQSSIINQAIERGPFIDQSQSMNLFISSPDFRKLSSCHFASWKGGLKTWSYYLRTRPVVDAGKFGLDISSIQRIKSKRSVQKKEIENLESKKIYHWEGNVLQFMGVENLFDTKSLEEVENFYLNYASKNGFDDLIRLFNVSSMTVDSLKSEILKSRLSDETVSMVCKRKRDIEDKENSCEMCSS